VGQGKTSYFPALCVTVNISKRYEIRPMTNRKLHVRFRLTPWSMTSDDLELL